MKSTTITVSAAVVVSALAACVALFIWGSGSNDASKAPLGGGREYVEDTQLGPSPGAYGEAEGQKISVTPRPLELAPDSVLSDIDKPYYWDNYDSLRQEYMTTNASPENHVTIESIKLKRSNRIAQEAVTLPSDEN